MKAKVKETGEIIEVKDYCSLIDYARGVYTEKISGRKFKEHELEFIQEKTNKSNIDWEQRRYELAKEYSKTFINLQHEAGRIDCGCYIPNVVKWSVDFAEALIEELKKEIK